MQESYSLFHVDLPPISDVASTTASSVVLGRYFVPFEGAFVGAQFSVSSPTGVSGRVGVRDLTSGANALEAFPTLTTSNTQFEGLVNSTFKNVYRRAGAQYQIRASVPTGNRLRGLRTRLVFKRSHLPDGYIKEGT
jgi:hypothetical protein